MTQRNIEKAFHLILDAIRISRQRFNKNESELTALKQEIFELKKKTHAHDDEIISLRKKVRRSSNGSKQYR